MHQPTFRQVLFKIATPHLKHMGFVYDKSLEDRAMNYGFRKHLNEEVDATVEFQRRAYEEVPYGYGFTVNLSRHHFDASGRKHFQRENADFSTRLGPLIVNAYGLWLYHFWGHWWDAATVEELHAELNDALQKLERYGVPALEDPNFRDAWPFGFPDEWDAFHDTLDKVLLSQLSSLGYEPKDDPIEPPSLKRRPRRRFLKQLANHQHCFIGFEPLQCRHRPKVNQEGLPLRHLGILIARKRSDDPNSEIDPTDEESFQGWLGPSSFDRNSVKERISDSAIWEYAAPTLPLQLSIAFEKLRLVGIPLLEDR